MDDKLKKVRISARINEALWRRIQNRAKIENRTDSNMIETALYESENIHSNGTGVK